MAQNGCYTLRKGVMSPYALLTVLFLYPVAFLVTPKFFFLVRPQMRPSASGSPSGADEQAKALLARLGVFIPLSIYALVAAGALAWQTLLSVDFDGSVFSINKWLTGSLVGVYLGTAWAGASVWLLALGAATGRMPILLDFLIHNLVSIQYRRMRLFRLSGNPGNRDERPPTLPKDLCAPLSYSIAARNSLLYYAES